MPDLPKTRLVAHGIDHVVGGLALRLIDYQRAVKRRRTRLSWHAWKIPCATLD
jgi:hypothetical protein